MYAPADQALLLNGGVLVLRKSALRRTLAIAVLLLAADDAAAQPVDEFFARKTITITIGYTSANTFPVNRR